MKRTYVLLPVIALVAVLTLMPLLGLTLRDARAGTADSATSRTRVLSTRAKYFLTAH